MPKLLHGMFYWHKKDNQREQSKKKKKHLLHMMGLGKANEQSNTDSLNTYTKVKDTANVLQKHWLQVQTCFLAQQNGNGVKEVNAQG